MARAVLDAPRPTGPYATPDMSAVDAADLMERTHRRELMIRDGTGVLGRVSEEDIVARVLAPGLDPARVPVRNFMHPAAPAFDDDGQPQAPLWASEALAILEDGVDSITEVLTGLCEECYDYSDELVEVEGLEMCPDCVGIVPNGAP